MLVRSIIRKSSISIVALGLAISFFTFSAVPSYGLVREPQWDQSIQRDGNRPEIRSLALNESIQVERGLPVRLKIPSIKINSAIEYVGLTNTGEMNVPKVPGNVGWFSLGPRPGEYGSAVIAGHYSWRGNGAGGVFRNLSKLSKGDMIHIVDDSGLTISFMVRQNRLFDFDADPSEVFASNSGTRLNLITCAGTWNSSEQSSTKRRVIFAELVQPNTEDNIVKFSVDSPTRQ